MAGRIPRSFIDELLARTDIVDVIDTRVQLRKTGSNYSARCPFHDEKTPSFSVSPDKQFYYCFGCGATGNAIGFLMEYEHMGFVEAVEELAGRAGLEVPHEGGGSEPPRVDHRPLFDVLERAAAWFQRQLREHPKAGRAVDYLKGRGLSGEIAKRFGLGYAPPGFENLLRALDGQRNPGPLVEAGLVIQREEDGRRYDRFRDRIIFPIRDQRGRVVGFGGRVLGDDTPKYLNSPETPVFHKGRELYGLFEARQALRHPERLLVVEGYMDVVALAQHDLPGTVATLGTATTAGHLERLYRVVPEVVFCFDGDAAGRKAAWKALEEALPFMREGLQGRFLFLPEGEDPDSLVRREGQAAFATRIESAQPLSAFLLESLSEQVDMDSLDGRARLVELARPYLERVPAGVFRTLLAGELARRADMDPHQLMPGQAPAAPRPRAPVRRPERQRHFRSLVRLAVSLLLQNPRLAALDCDLEGLRASGVAGADLLVQLLELFRNNPNMTTGAALERWRDTPTLSQLTRLLTLEQLLSDAEVEQEFLDATRSIAARGVEARLEQLHARLKRGDLNRDEIMEYQRLAAVKAGKRSE
jgi:DNA primase